jgi:DNA-binding transcriptional MocR family regulator
MAKTFSRFKRKGGYIQKHEEWLSSPAYRDLSLLGRCLLEEFQRVHRPGRNGKLVLSVRTAADLLNVSTDTASKAFHELAEHGFIDLVTGEYWQERKAREWKLTFEQMNAREPTDDWKHWEPGKPVSIVPKKSKKRTKPDPKKLDRTVLPFRTDHPKI